jgi:hypothetical protein
MLGFQLPPELLPLRVERATLNVQLSASGRLLELLSGAGEVPEVLEKRTSPVGRCRFEITRADVLQPDTEGRIHLGLAVGSAGRIGGQDIASLEWKVDEVELEVFGQVPGPSGAGDPTLPGAR